VAFVGVGSVTNNVLTITTTESGSLAQGQPVTAAGVGALNEGCYVATVNSNGTYQLGNLPNGTNVPAGTTFYTPGVLTTTQGAGWSTGSQNLVPVQISGSVPNPLVAGQVYWGQINGTALSLNSNPNGAGSVSVTTAGTFTATPVPGFGYFNRLSFAGPDAKYLYFQGTGSQGPETSARAQQNQLYVQSSGLVPPYDPSLSGVSMGGSVRDTTYPFAWNPYNQATIPNNVNAAGDGEFIGALMSVQVVDFLNQSALSEQQIRIIGWAGGLMPYDLKDPTLGTALNMSGNTYTGLQASNPSIYWDGATASGFTQPGPAGANQTGPMGIGADDGSHMPFVSFWAYLRTGELQYFDYMVDIALGSALLSNTSRNPNSAAGDSPYPGITYGVATYAAQQYRGMGWDLRNIECTALLAPYNPTTPAALDFDGTQRSKMLNDLADLAANFPIDQWNFGKSTFVTPYMQSASVWAAYNSALYNGGPGYGQGPFWEQCYVGLGMCYAAARGNAKAKEFLTLLGTRAAYVGSTYGFFPLYAYNQAFCIDSPAAPDNVGLVPINADNEYTISQVPLLAPGPSWAANSGGTTLAFTFAVNTPSQGYVPQNGDVYTPYDGNGILRPSEIADGSFYQIVGLSGSSFNLAPIGTTTPVAIAEGGGEFNCNIMPVAPGPPNTVPYAPNFMYQVGEVATWANLVFGITQWATTVADIQHRQATNGQGFGPSYVLSSTDFFNPDDPRYIVNRQ
jgi:hypothetical protein